MKSAMPRLDQIAQKVRSKNAGPFWITVDIFCAGDKAFDIVRQSVSEARAAEITGVTADKIKRFEIPFLRVLKISVQRTHVQGSRFDRDMHGAQLAVLFAELEI